MNPISSSSYNLLIIEAPGKVAKLRHLLKDHQTLILATGGHFKQLSKKGLYYSGVDSNFDFHFELKPLAQSKGKDFVTRLNEMLESYSISNIYLATDPDREGESISWHIYQHIPSNLKSITKRITFNEISYDAISNALKNARDIDQNLVDSQFARQGYDVLFGFMSSSLVKKHGMQSNGRIQGVANKLIYDRTTEIQNFVPNNKYLIKSVIKDEANTKSDLKHVGKDLKPLTFDDQSQVPKINESFIYTQSIPSQTKYKYPDKPFVMSTLLAQASKALRTTPKGIEAALQTLYQSGYITYHRTDNPNISNEFFVTLSKYLKSQNLHPITQKRSFEFKGQGAHEAIRVTKLNVTSLEGITANEMYQKLYTMIRLNTLAQGIKPDSYQSVIEKFENNGEIFVYSWNKTIDSPMNELLKKEFNSVIKESVTPKLTLSKNYPGKSEIKFETINQKPSQYNESTLIKELESRNIGRPSTFASFGNIIKDRNYVILKDNKFEITDLGIKFEEINQKIFADFVNYDFTKNFELQLDDIATGKLKYKAFLKDKYESILKVIQSHQSTPKTVNLITSDRFCDVCKENKIEGVAKNGNKFYKCKNSNWKTKSGCPYEWT